MIITRETPISEIFHKNENTLITRCRHYLMLGGVDTFGEFVDIYANDRNRFRSSPFRCLGPACLNLMKLKLYSICFASGYEVDQPLREEIIRILEEYSEEEEQKEAAIKANRAKEVVDLIIRLYGPIEHMGCLEFDLEDLFQSTGSRCEDLQTLYGELYKEVERRQSEKEQKSNEQD